MNLFYIDLELEIYEYNPIQCIEISTEDKEKNVTQILHMTIASLPIVMK